MQICESAAFCHFAWFSWDLWDSRLELLLLLHYNFLLLADHALDTTHVERFVLVVFAVPKLLSAHQIWLVLGTTLGFVADYRVGNLGSIRFILLSFSKQPFLNRLRQISCQILVYLGSSNYLVFILLQILLVHFVAEVLADLIVIATNWAFIILWQIPFCAFTPGHICFFLFF